MRGRAEETETIQASTARARWSRLLNEVFRTRKRVVVEKSGIPVAALISVADLRRLERLDAERERDFAILREFGEAFADASPEEIEREVNKAVAEVRAEMRAERRQQEQRAATP